MLRTIQVTTVSSIQSIPVEHVFSVLFATSVHESPKWNSKKAARLAALAWRSSRGAGAAGVARRGRHRCANGALGRPDGNTVAADLDFDSHVALLGNDGEATAIHGIELVHAQFVSLAVRVSLLLCYGRATPSY